MTGDILTSQVKRLAIGAIRAAILPSLSAFGGTCLWHTHVGTVVLQRLLKGHSTKVQWGVGGVSVPLLRLAPPTLGSRDIGCSREKASLLGGAFHSWIILIDWPRVQVVDLALDMFRHRGDLSPLEYPLVPRYLWADVRWGVGDDMVVCQVPWRRINYLSYPELKDDVHAWIEMNEEPLNLMIEDAWDRLVITARRKGVLI